LLRPNGGIGSRLSQLAKNTWQPETDISTGGAQKT